MPKISFAMSGRSTYVCDRTHISLPKTAVPTHFTLARAYSRPTLKQYASYTRFGTSSWNLSTRRRVSDQSSVYHMETMMHWGRYELPTLTFLQVQWTRPLLFSMRRTLLFRPKSRALQVLRWNTYCLFSRSLLSTLAMQATQLHISQSSHFCLSCATNYMERTPIQEQSRGKKASQHLNLLRVSCSG